MELVTSIIGGKAPRDGAALSIAIGLQGSNTLVQVLHACHPTRQTASRKDTDLDLRHVQPTAMFGRVMKLDSLQDPPRLGWREGFIQGSGRMRVEVILHDANVFHVRIDRIDQPSDAVRVVDLGTVLGHLDMAPARRRLDEEKQIGGAPALILSKNTRRLSCVHWP